MIKIAVIGCGRIAKIAHFPAFAQMDNVIVKYACDLNLEKAQALKDEYPDKIENVIIATDDTFVTERNKDEHILKSAKVDAEQVCKVVMSKGVYICNLAKKQQ